MKQGDGACLTVANWFCLKGESTTPFKKICWSRVMSFCALGYGASMKLGSHWAAMRPHKVAKNHILKNHHFQPKIDLLFYEIIKGHTAHNQNYLHEKLRNSFTFSVTKIVFLFLIFIYRSGQWPCICAWSRTSQECNRVGLPTLNGVQSRHYKEENYWHPWTNQNKGSIKNQFS